MFVSSNLKNDFMKLYKELQYRRTIFANISQTCYFSLCKWFHGCHLEKSCYCVLSLHLDGKAVVECDPLGTDLYMSPEALKDRSQVGLASDIWSLGVLLFFSLVSRHVEHFRPLTRAVRT